MSTRAGPPLVTAPPAAEPLWIAFLNTAPPPGSETADVLRDFDRFVSWLVAAAALDADRSPGIRRRAEQQPAGAAAVLAEARRVRGALRGLADAGVAGNSSPARRVRAEADALAEINRVLGRSAGMRRLARHPDGRYARTFVTVGDAFAALLVPLVDSAADTLVEGAIARVRSCADPRCGRAFVDATRNGRRRWCDMATCGNRAKAARHRGRMISAAQAGVGASFR